MNVFAVVKDNVTAKDVAMRYGIKINRSGLACCPFHRDKTPSMKIDKRYYCFGCGETGDATDLVAKYFGLAPKEAAMKIASDFGLNYDATVHYQNRQYRRNRKSRYWMRNRRNVLGNYPTIIIC